MRLILETETKGGEPLSITYTVFSLTQIERIIPKWVKQYGNNPYFNVYLKVDSILHTFQLVK